MEQNSMLDELLGTGLPETTLLKSFLDVERRLLEKLVLDFDLEPEVRSETIRALYWFRQTYKYYIDLWIREPGRLTPDQIAKAHRIFSPIAYNLNRDSRSCFSKEEFFGKARFLLQACGGLGVTAQSRKTYLKWLYAFPITPESSIEKLLEHDLYPANLPHIYMHQLSGLVRQRLVTRSTPRNISGQYKMFLREIHLSQAEARWFRTRYAGSYGSRQ